jgi:predicted transcriptional regulator
MALQHEIWLFMKKEGEWVTSLILAEKLNANKIIINRCLNKLLRSKSIERKKSLHDYGVGKCFIYEYKVVLSERNQ